MIIKKLTINNFRNYTGSSTFDLTTNLERNIILIGGQNGAGKTSLADAIRLCLYGHWVDGRILSESKYQEYLDNICSVKSKSDEFFVSIDLTIDEENPPIDVNVTRRFKKKGEKFKEELILKRDGSEVELIDETYWSYYIEKLISPTVSRYFFFDGEKVRDTIASPESKDYLIKAVNDISGITQLENLKTDLGEVKKRIISKTEQKGSLKKIEDLTEEINILTEKIREIDNQIENQGFFIDGYRTDLEDLEQERARLIGSSDSKRMEINGRIKELKQSFDDINQEVIDFCSSRMMYWLADRSIRETVSQAKEENRSLISRYSVESLIDLRDSGNGPDIMGLDQQTADMVLNNMILALSKTDKNNTESLLDLTLPRIEQIESMRVSQDELDGFMDIFNNREYYAQELEKYQKRLSKTEDASLGEIDNKLISLKTQIEIAQFEINRLENQKIDLESQITNLNSKLKKEERTVILADVDKAALENIDKAIESINERVEISLLKSKQTLVKKINEMYDALKNTKDMVKEIRISDAFDLELISFEDREINKEFISEGEKGILMYSVVYGLHSLSSMKFPMIIDSPLGRMDTLHVNNLASKLFPSVSEQVILLSHDREVIGENHQLIKNNVSREYLITKFGIPKVTEGYFE